MAPVPNWTNLERNILSAFEEQAVNVPGQPHERSLGLIHSRDVPNPFDESNPKPKTPIIAGTVCGGVVFLAWVIGFSIYFHKRYRRKKRKRLAAEGKAEHPDAAAEEEAPQVVVPPDPAVLLGYHRDSDKANNVSPVKAPNKPLHREG